MKILLLYTTRESQTEKIMTRICSLLQKEHDCELVQLQKNSQIDLSQYQAVLIASSIRYGYYHKLMVKFTQEHASELNKMITGFVGVNLVARKPNKNTPETNVYTRKFLEKSPWHPSITVVFAGALYYPKYNWFDRNMIRFIMLLGKGETDVTKEVIEYTDWNKVEVFVDQFNCLIAPENQK